jgi:pimeloyl-ACP methyl ester carboxylesterase
VWDFSFGLRGQHFILRVRSKAMNKLILILLLVSLGYSLAQTYEVTPCPSPLLRGEVEGQTIVCGTLSVPERHTKLFGKKLKLAVLTLKATGTTQKPDPIIFLQGGPGGAALETVSIWRDRSWRTERDIILVDQRGTGYSEPDLRCPELYASLDILDGVELCHRRLSRSVNLQAFNSHENAADIDTLRKALGFKEVNLFGVSYGTRLALTLMRDYPKGIRSVILDSTYPPQVDRLAETEVNFYQLLKKVFDDCHNDPDCQAAYPTLEHDFLAGLETLNNTPAEIWFNTLYLNGDDFLSLYFQSMYNERITPNLPYSMSKLSNGDYDASLLLLTGMAEPKDLDNQGALVGKFIQMIIEALQNRWREVEAEGVYFSTECQEDILFHNQKQIEQATRDLPIFIQNSALEQAKTMFELCQAWHVSRSPGLENQAVVSDIPTLVLAGAYDPVTAPAWGKLASETLSRSFFYTFPNAAHGVFASGDCPVAMIGDFLDIPTTAPNNTCMETLEMKFYVP